VRLGAQQRLERRAVRVGGVYDLGALDLAAPRHLHDPAAGAARGRHDGAHLGVRLQVDALRQVGAHHVCRQLPRVHRRSGPGVAGLGSFDAGYLQDRLAMARDSGVGDACVGPYLFGFGWVLCDLDVVNLAAGCLAPFKGGFGSLGSVGGLRNIQRIPNPEVTVDVMLAYVCYQLGPRVLLFFQNLRSKVQKGG
jgi:hypothetical protein